LAGYQYNYLAMTDELLRYRAEFPILEKTTYLISNSLGAMPRGVWDSLRQFPDLWAARGVRAWEDEWWMLALEVGNEIGELMNAPKNTVSLHQNVTTCEQVVASCFDFKGKRNKVVYSDMNFPSVMYFWEAQKRYGARVHMVPTNGVEADTQAIVDAIDEDTLVVPISYVLFRSAYIKEVEPIIEKAHKVGAYVVLDTFQALGTVPVDVQKLNVDFATGGVLKWLCGGPGVTYLYVRPDVAEKLQPAFTGWSAHQNPFAFATGEQTYTEPPYKFLNGSPLVAPIYAARPGVNIIREIGVEKIRAKSMRQTAKLVEMADARGWKVTAPRDPARRGGTVAIDMPNAKEVCYELLKRDIIVDYRPKAGVRFAPHFYTSDAEIDTAIGTVEEILSTMSVGAADSGSGKARIL
jgi:kynureninase